MKSENKPQIKNLLLIASVSFLLCFGVTLAYFTDTDQKQNVVAIGNVKLSLTEEGYDDKQTAVPGQIITKPPVLTNEGSREEYVFLEISMPKASVQMLYEQDEAVYQTTDAEYVTKIGDSYYKAMEEHIYTSTSETLDSGIAFTLAEPEPDNIYTYQDEDGTAYYVIKENDTCYLADRKVNYSDNSLIFTKTSEIINENSANLTKFSDPNQVHKYSYTNSDNQTAYAVMTGTSGIYYKASRTVVYANTGIKVENPNISANSTPVAEYQAGTKKDNAKKVQEIFRTIAKNGETVVLDEKTTPFQYHDKKTDNSQEGWRFIEVKSDSASEKIYIFGYNRKLLAVEETKDSTLPVFDSVQLMSFIDEQIQGGTETKIKINAYGIQADNLNLTLDNYLTDEQMQAIYSIVKQKTE